MRRILTLWLAFLLLTAGCGAGEEKEFVPLFSGEGETDWAQPIPVLMTLSEKEASFTYTCAQHFKELVESYSQGRFYVDIYPDNGIGSMETSDYMLQHNRVQLRLGPGPSQLVHFLGLTSLSQSTLESIPKIMSDPEWLELLNEECLEKGTRLLGALPPLYRVVTSDRPIETAEEFQGLRMRYTGSIYSQTIWEPLGCTMVKVDLDSIEAALNSRVVDAWTDNTLIHYLMFERYRIQTYVMETRQQIYIEPFYVSEAFFQSLSGEDQALFQRAVDETALWAQTARETWISAYKGELEQYGVEHILLSEEELAKISGQNHDQLLELMEERIGEERIQRAYALLERDSG